MISNSADEATISGHLGTIDVQDVMAFLANLNQAGTLEIDSTDGQLLLYFEGGHVVGGEVPRGGHDMGDVLVRHGRLTLETLADLRGQDTEISQALIDAGDLEAEEIPDLDAEVLYGNILNVFRWTPGDFSFFEGRSAPDGIRPVQIGVRGLLLEATRRSTSWDDLPKLYRDPDTRFEIRMEPDEDDGVALALEEWRIFYLAANRRRLVKIWDESPFENRFETSRSLFGLVTSRYLQPELDKNSDDSTTAPSLPDEVEPPRILNDDAATEIVDWDDAGDTKPLLAPASSPPEALPSAGLGEAPRRLTRAEIHVERSVRLVQLEPKCDDCALPISGEKITIGRAPDNRVILPEPYVSGHHARIMREDDHYTIDDTHSSNGIRVDSQKIFRAILRGGEEIAIYPYRFRFEVVFDVETEGDEPRSPQA